MPPPPEFRIKILDPAVHRREGFSCESTELTSFLQTRARKEAQARASACFVLVPLNDPARIAGFYTLSATSLELTDLPPDFSKRLPRYPKIPATLLGRLARDLTFKGQGVGDLMMVDALRRAYLNGSIIGAVAVVTDPKDEKAANFYRKYRFESLNEQRMFLPMKIAAQWFDFNDTAQP